MIHKFTIITLGHNNLAHKFIKKVYESLKNSIISRLIEEDKLAPGILHKIDSEISGYDNAVNEFIDYPVRWLGPNHRKMFHTLNEAMLIGYMVDGPRGALGGISHLMLDGVLTDEEIAMINQAIFKYYEIKFKLEWINFMTETWKLEKERENQGDPKKTKKETTFTILGTPVNQQKKDKTKKAERITKNKNKKQTR